MPLTRPLLLVLMGSTLAPSTARLAPPAATATPIAQRPTVTLLGYRALVPEGWSSRPPSSNMRLAEFSAGRDGAEVVAYFFGPGQGGSIDANLARWKGQFSNPAGGPVAEVITRDSSGAFPLTIAEYRGSYARGIGAGAAPDKALPDHVLLAVVADTPKGRIFFQMYGPARAVATQRAAYLAFVRALA